MPIIKKIVYISLLFIIITTKTCALPQQVLNTKNSIFSIITFFENSEGKKLKLSGMGTGFLINDNGNVLTNHHVIDTESLLVANITLLLEEKGKIIKCDFSDLQNRLATLSNFCKKNFSTTLKVVEILTKDYKPKIKIIDGNKLTELNMKDAELLWDNKTNDIALLSVNFLRNKPSLTFSEVVPKQLSKVFAIGFPGVTSNRRLDHETIQATVTDGSISAILDRGVTGISTRVIQHNANVNPGNSGGPLVDECGLVIGINTQAITEDEGRTTQGIYFSSHIGFILKKLKTKNIKFNSIFSPCVSGTEKLSKQSTYGIIGSIFGVIVAIIAIILSLKKPRQKIITQLETYTQYIRRGVKKDSSDKFSTSYSPKKKWVLSGTIGDTGESVSIEITEDELLHGKDITIGRSRKLCDYAIPDVRKLSRRHARFILRNNELMVEDLNSSNKTYISDKELIPGKPASLESGSVLNLGNSVYLTLS